MVNRIVRDLILILFILIMPMWLMELLKIDMSLQKIMEESDDIFYEYKSNKG